MERVQVTAASRNLSCMVVVEESKGTVSLVRVQA